MWLKLCLLLMYITVLFMLARLVEALTWYETGSLSRRLLDPMTLSVAKLKALLEQRGVSYDTVVEKAELTKLVEGSGNKDPSSGLVKDYFPCCMIRIQMFISHESEPIQRLCTSPLCLTAPPHPPPPPARIFSNILEQHCRIITPGHSVMRVHRPLHLYTNNAW